jgi:hypothetical protein
MAILIWLMNLCVGLGGTISSLVYLGSDGVAGGLWMRAGIIDHFMLEGDAERTATGTGGDP